MAESNRPVKASGMGGAPAAPGPAPQAGAKGTIAFVALEFYPATAGGTGILLHHTVASLLRRGYTVLLLVDMQRHEVERIRHEVRLGFVNGDRLAVHLVDDLLVGPAGAALEGVSFADPEQRRSARFALALKALSSTTPIDMVEFYDYCGPAYYSLAEAGQGGMPPVAVRLHNTVELIARRIRSPLDPDRLLQFGMERAAIAGADMLLAPGDAYFREEILALYPEASGVPAQVSPPIHAPVGSVAYDPFANDVAFYGRLSTFKGIDTFMRAAVAALDDPAFERWLGRFLVIGPEETVAGGMSLEALRAMVPARFAERFAFTGRLHHEELFARLQSAAFACFANRIESFCYAAHELATAGMPLILSDTPAFRDHFAEGRDARFFDGTAGALATEMRALAQDAVARARLSAAGRARIDGYDTTDHYAAHLSALPPSGSGASEASFDTTVVVFSDGDRVAEARSLATVGERKVLVLERDAPGSGWRARDAHGEGVNLDRAPAGVAALFLRAGDAVDPDWLSAAERALQGRRTAGAVGGWQRHGDVLRAPGHAPLPETALSEAPGLRMIVRLATGLCWAEALGSMGAAGELPLLLAHRAAGHVLLTLPMPSVDTTDAVSLPAPTLRDVASRDYGLLRHDMLALLAAHAPASDRNEDAAGAARAATLADPSLIVIDLVPGSGELLILRAFDGDEGLALPWSSVSLEGHWTSVFDAGGPVDGALRTEDGRLSLRLSEGGRVELLCGPHAGTITLTHRGRSATHALAASEIADGALTIKAGKARFAQPTRHEKPAGVGSLPLPSAALPLGTVFLAAEPDDFAHWPLSDRILPRQLLLDDFLDRPDAPDDLRAAAEAFASHLERLGVERVVLSSRLPASGRLMASLAALPGRIAVTLACVDAAPDAEVPAVERLEAAGRWLGALKRLRAERLAPLATPSSAGVENGAMPQALVPAARALHIRRGAGRQRAPSKPLRVVGPSPGILGAFAAAGLDTQYAPLPIGAPPPRPADLLAGQAKHRGLQIALLPGRSVSSGIMHMLGAAWLAHREGLEIEQLVLPASHREDFVFPREIASGLPIAWHAGPFLGPPNGAVGIAISAWPDEEWPASLARAVSDGWLPLAGATSALDRHPAASALFVEPYWEDAARLSERLSQLAACPVEARTALREAADAIVAEGEAAVAQLCPCGDAPVAVAVAS